MFHECFGDADGHAVVGNHRGGRLGVAQLFKVDAYWRTIFATLEKGGQFSLRNAREDFVHNFLQGKTMSQLMGGKLSLGAGGWFW